jgi:DNA polymerase III delta prime subunit
MKQRRNGFLTIFKMKTFQNNKWQEKYRPKHISDVVLPKHVKDDLEKIIKENSLPDLLLYYPKPGNGKTSLARSLCRDLQIDDVLYINASLEGSIDTIRNEMTSFCSTISVSGKLKVIILDEAEGASLSFQNSAKVFIEEYSNVCRFILITNNENKIIKPLRSRCTPVEFRFDDAKVRKEMVPKIKGRLKTILTAENTTCEDSILDKLVSRFYPDIRSMVKSLHMEFIRNGKITESVIGLIEEEQDIGDLILNKKLTLARNYVRDNTLDYATVYTNLLDYFVPRLDNNNKKSDAIKTIANYADHHTRSFNPDIPFSACVVSLIEIVSRK